jgi:hypothetical protein
LKGGGEGGGGGVEGRPHNIMRMIHHVKAIQRLAKEQKVSKCKGIELGKKKGIDFARV